MTFPSQRTLTQVGRYYRQTFGTRMEIFTPSGERRRPTLGHCGRESIPFHAQTAAYSLQEAVHWGEPYVFSWSPGIHDWMVALVDQQTVQGGLTGGLVMAEGSSRHEIIDGLVDQSMKPESATRIVDRLPIWSPARIREAALALQTLFYQVSGWKPLLLEENRIKAQQQRQITSAMDEQKKAGHTAYPIDKERMLLSLIRAGDKNGARHVLNEMLGAMFLFSPKLAILRARAIEMMGYLTRAAVEDSPLLEPLIERNHQWMERLIGARDFETLSHVLMRALDDFMEGIYAHGFNCYHPKASRALDYIAAHYLEPISLDDIARAVGLSAFRVGHLLKQHTGKTALQHIMRLKIQKARELLERTSLSCPDIATEAGFCDQSYFIKHFKRVVGATPARYRRTRRLSATGPAA